MTEMKESLPKSGHVNEVCKEWLVREDGALAYRLQNQEINEFYNGNKFRNAVVRQDFPTALHEQIKEKEDAEKKAALYQRMITEQEQADAVLARNISERLEKERECERLKECNENESMARLLQRIYIEKSDQVWSNHITPVPNAQLPYPKSVKPNPISYAETNTAHQSDAFSKNSSRIQQPGQGTETMGFNKNIRPIVQREVCRDDQKKIAITKESSDVMSCIRQYNLSSHDRSSFDTADYLRAKPIHLPNNLPVNDSRASDIDLIPNKCHLQKLSPEKFDYLMRNLPIDDATGSNNSSLNESYNRNDIQYQGAVNLKRLVPNLENVSVLKELGIASEEIIDLDHKIEQEKKDEELALRLQQEEQRVSLTQEERDRLLAIEAQDKELAKMLQEREKAKAKRAKEKARLRKSQSKTGSEAEGSGVMSHSLDHSPTETNNFLLDKDSYSNPIDLIPTISHNITFGVRKPNDITQQPTREDEIYTLPVESELKGLNETNSTYFENQIQHQRRSEHVGENIATVIDPTYASTNYLPQNTLGNLSPLGYSSSTAPPYMPIQGTRRSASLEAKKKRTKDKCTHQ